MNTRKTIGISMIALLVVALSVSMAAATPYIAATDSSGDTRPASVPYTEGEAIWVEVYGHGVTNGDTATIHVVYANNAHTWSASETIDTAEHPQVHVITVDYADVTGDKIFATLGTVNTNIPCPGEFDLIFNQDADESIPTYDPSADGVNQESICSAFSTAIPEFATIAIPVLALLGLVLYMRRKKD